MGIRSHYPLFWVSKFDDVKFYQTTDKYNSEKLKQSDATFRLADPQDNFTGPISPMTMNRFIGLMDPTEPTKDIAVTGVLPTLSESETEEPTLWTTTCQCPSGKIIEVLSKDSNCFTSLCTNGYKMGCEVRKISEIEYTIAICFIKTDGMTDPAKMLYELSGSLEDLTVDSAPGIKDSVRGRDRKRILTNWPPSGTPVAVTRSGAHADSAFWGFKETDKTPRNNHVDQKPKDATWTLTFESPTLNYAAKMLQFEG